MKLVDIYDDATGKVVNQVPCYNGEEMEAMVDKAFEAQNDWFKIPMWKKGKILYKLMDILDEKREEMCLAMELEMGKRVLNAHTEAAYSTEIGREGIESCKHHYGEVFNSNAEGYDSSLVFTRRHPLGVIAAVIPFNFPVELTIQKLVPALMMGNTILFKAPTACPGAVKIICDACEEAGIPEGVVQFVFGSREDCTEHIFQNKKISCIALTGSTAAGEEMMVNASHGVKNVILELGGNDPMIIREDVKDDPELLISAILGLVGGRIIENNGQVCASPKRLIIHKSVKDVFIKGLISVLDSLKMGHATDEDVEITRLVSEKAAINVEEMIRKTVDQGANVIYGGKREGARIVPTILDNVTKDMDIACDMEVFAPVVPVITFETDEEALAIANQSKYGLSSCVYTADMKKAFWYCQFVQSSATVVNATSACRHHEQPFGGCKSTGIGGEGACSSPEEYSYAKTYNIANAVTYTPQWMDDGLDMPMEEYYAEKAELLVKELGY